MPSFRLLITQHVEVGVDRRDVAQPARERHRVAQTQRIDLRLDFGAQFAIADDHEARVRQLRLDARRRFQKQAVILDRDQPPDDADQRRVVGDAVVAPERAVFALDGGERR